MIRPVVIGGTDVTEHLDDLVAAAPPLTPEQRSHLREIFAPFRVPARPAGTRRADAPREKHTRASA